jgi:RNA recognition motif-containing protein
MVNSWQLINEQHLLPWVCVSRSYRETSEDANNPGNNLYVTGLSVRVSEKELQDHFEREGKVIKFLLLFTLGFLCQFSIVCLSLSTTNTCLVSIEM